MPFVGIGVGIGRQRFSGGFDADYQAVLDYATTQGYTLPSAGQQVLQNQLVVDLKAGGIWSKLDTFAVFATDGDSDFALIDWKRLTDYSGINAPTFTTNQGFNGDGTSAYIDTNFNAFTQGVNYTLDNASRYAYMYQCQANSVIDIASSVSNTRNRMAIFSTTIQSINSAGLTNSAAFAYTTNAGMKSINRLNSSSVNLYNDKVFSTVTSNSVIVEDFNQWLLRAATGFSSTNIISMYAMGGDLVAENDDFVDAFDTYINAL